MIVDSPQSDYHEPPSFTPPDFIPGKHALVLANPATTSVSKLKLSLGPISQIPPFNPKRAKPATPRGKPATTPIMEESGRVSHHFNHPITFTPLNDPGQGHAASSSASSTETEVAANPFFHDRALKNRASIHVKEDFSPFKSGTARDPSSVSQLAFAPSILLLLFLRDGTVPSVKFGWGTELGSGPGWGSAPTRSSNMRGSLRGRQVRYQSRSRHFGSLAGCNVRSAFQSRKVKFGSAMGGNLRRASVVEREQARKKADVRESTLERRPTCETANSRDSKLARRQQTRETANWRDCQLARWPTRETANHRDGQLARKQTCENASSEMANLRDSKLASKLAKSTRETANSRDAQLARLPTRETPNSRDSKPARRPSSENAVS
ncbi:hypothetical protein BT69DRAFT_1365785 [Atractiella rhizophila]|nr:hypothetical protein BT69DRAFT_1365785 [Atractiella rhizophila]